MSIINRLKSHRVLALLFYHAVLFVIIVANFPVGKFFIGWDALNPEFNFALNFQRVLTPFWQENQGLGLLGGHGFAAVLPHIFITFFLSLFLRLNEIRPAFTFLFLYLGGLGMFFLTELLVSKISEKKYIVHPFLYTFIPLLSALFYVLNLGTLQMFYLQLEAFVFHFTSLPWLFFIFMKFLDRPSKKHMLAFIAINFIASTQGFIPPLFVVYMCILILFLICFIVHEKFSVASLKKSLAVFFLTLVVNLYWLLPLGYYTATRSNIYLSSYNNLASTPEFVEKNKKYGGIKDVPLIRGFIWEGIEFSDNQSILYVFQPWINHFQNPRVLFLGYVFFVISAVGVGFSLFFLKEWWIKSFAFIYLFFFTGLATNFPPFSLVTWILQEPPIYKQAFRAAFTKFSIGLSFSYSIFFGFGIICIIFLAAKVWRRFHSSMKFQNIFFGLFQFLLLASLVYYALPTFQGSFLYRRLILDIPEAYFQVMNYFKGQFDGRIADLPVDCPEGWYNYLWGYTGSGFYWYGIKQPILSRTFDVWSNYNENYYWELTQAAREKNFANFDAVFQKYDVRWILYDPNLEHCRGSRGFLHYDQIINDIKFSPNYTLLKVFSAPNALPILLFENKQNASSQFIALRKNLPNAGPVYRWSDNDTAYRQVGDYLSDEDKPYDVYFPFRSLFSKRTPSENEFAVDIGKDTIGFQTVIPKSLQYHTVSLDTYKELEDILPASIAVESDSGSGHAVYIQYDLPEIFLDGKTILSKPNKIRLGNFYSPQKFELFVNGDKLPFNVLTHTYHVDISTSITNKIVITGSGKELFSWNSDNDSEYISIINTPLIIPIESFTSGKLEVTISKLTDSNYTFQSTSQLTKFHPIACNEIYPSNKNTSSLIHDQDGQYIRLTSVDSRQCLIFNLSQFPSFLGYLISLESRNIQGNNPLFYISNNRRIHYIDAFIPQSSTRKMNYFILPPSFPYERGYDVYFDNYSRTDNPTVNDFKDIKIYPIPYQFLTELKIVKESHISERVRPLGTLRSDPKLLEVDHPNPSFYQVAIDSSTIGGAMAFAPLQPVTPEVSSGFLVLSQSYDKGWRAYEITNDWFTDSWYMKLLIPFFQPEIKDHVLVNNWENGWQIGDLSLADSRLQKGNLATNDQRQTTTIAIVYLPQYLEYLGFGLLGGLCIYLLLYKSRNYKL